ncbi:MAG: adenosine deaminase [Novosphingobium sp.]|jgi:adenosine deaminase|nr:adenosine deaminase [Novosphingobium sp.]
MRGGAILGTALGAILLAALPGGAAAAQAQTASSPPADEAAVAALFDRVVDRPARLRVFLQAMPKGGDLHNHLWGQPYAEQFMAWGAQAGLCASRRALAIAPPPCHAPDSEPLKDLGQRDEALWTAMIEALSTRGRAQGLGVNTVTGHDDFFGSFDRFGAVAMHEPGAMLASARASAAAGQVSYLELMQNPAAATRAARIADDTPWNPDDFAGALRALAPALPALVEQGVAETDAMERDAARRLGCRGDASAPGACAVTVRYQAFALRGLPPAQVFAQLAYAFALVERDPRYVGINFVAPEDGPVAIGDFDLHMCMFRFFAARHRQVKLSLHAGELDLGLVPPSDLAHHIRDSIEIAGARRIGHGVAIAYEADAPGLLARMARDRIAVEINLTSNDTILGVRGARHPLALYRAAGVPVVLSTDDEGVSRSDMTNEYLRAATEQGLRYADLKQIARASLEYAFLPGASLWRDGRIGERAAPCGDAPAPPACAALLAASDKARAQWRLEQELSRFEQSILTQRF